MNTVEIILQGLCLWLTGYEAGLIAVLPDFHRATPAHSAVLTLAKESVVERRCPEFFTDTGNDCVFILNGSGAAGGVKIDVAGDIAETPDPAGLKLIPPIQHHTPLRMRREYAPDDGSRLAAQLVVKRGTITSEEEDCGRSPDCPRYVRWTLTGGGGDLTLLLSNLLGGRALAVKVKPGAVVTIRNQAVDPKQSKDIAHWCLYFTMFEDAGCPGKPPVTAAPPRTAKRTPPPHAHGNAPAIETIACSNSQYP